MQLYQKPPLKIHEQVQKLKRRGLIIPDEAHASSYLEQIGFYRLSAYFIPFEDISNSSVEHAFLENTHVDQMTLTPRQQTAMGFPDHWQTMPFWEGALQQAQSG